MAPYRLDLPGPRPCAQAQYKDLEGDIPKFSSFKACFWSLECFLKASFVEFEEVIRVKGNTPMIRRLGDVPPGLDFGIYDQ